MTRSQAVLTLALLLALPGAARAQTTTLLHAPTGSVSSTLEVTMNFTGGGSALLYPAVGPNCYLGMTCGFSGSSLGYTLADGTTAALTNFHGTFAPYGTINAYRIVGRASGMNSAGHAVTVDRVQVTMTITCRSGRGGGCTKTYTGGSLKLTVN